VHELTGSITFVGVSDLDQADDFYGRALGLELRDERPFALVAELGATMLRITAVQAVVAAPYTVAGFVVGDIDAAVDALVSRGVRFTVYDGMGQDDRAIWTSPSGARIAWFLDPDANNLSLTQFG
jgi:catechol 2,3-dioxygenase-like lactoylglutathione lyase family enzyme